MPSSPIASRPSAREFDVSTVRRDFPILDQTVHGHPLVYLDNAASSQKPLSVLKAIQNYYTHDHANVHRGIHELSNRATAAYEAARERAQRFFNAAQPQEIIFTRGTTDGINLIAQAWGDANVQPGDRILLTEMEHHSNLVPWQLLAQRRGAELVFLPVKDDGGCLDLARLDEILDRGVKMVAFTHISNTLGTINPAAELCARARAAGALTLVDAAQSAGHCPIDVQALGCDFLACSGHKICGPTGIGVLYGRYDALDRLPPYQGGGEMIESVSFHESSFLDPPHRFEAGTPNIAGAIGLHAAMDYLDQIGRDRISEHDRALSDYAYEHLAAMPGLRLFGPAQERSGLISFVLTEMHASDLVMIVDQRGVALRGGHHCNQPLMRKLKVDATARASFYFYNTFAEVDRLAEVIAEAQRFVAT